jgi:diacylglycerol kinase (ATP)
MKVAVIAHAGKSLGGGLPELRRRLKAHGIADPVWFEVDKAKQAPDRVRRALEHDPQLLIAWGGDGMVRRCASLLAGAPVDLAIVPAGSANLFATNLGIPADLEQAVAVALDGARRACDVGTFGDERFTCFAGVGFDALMIRDADRLKTRIGKLGYVWGGARNLGAPSFGAEITIDGVPWFEGQVATILVGNVGSLFGGLTAFRDAEPDDGRLDVGIVTAEGAIQWARTLGRALSGAPERSPFVRVTQARTVEARIDRKVRYELDGGDRGKVKRFKAGIEPRALNVRVPTEDGVTR